MVIPDEGVKYRRDIKISTVSLLRRCVVIVILAATFTQQNLYEEYDTIR